MTTQPLRPNTEHLTLNTSPDNRKSSIENRKSLDLELPLPPRKLSPNSRAHWRAKADMTARYRERIKRHAEDQAQGVTFEAATIELYFFLDPKKTAAGKLYAPRDEANAIASFKAAQDGLVDAGILPNDAKKHLKQGSVTIYSKAPDHQNKAVILVRLTEGLHANR